MAEQWKNWTVIYSIYCLKGILPDEHLKCWQTFVLACKYLCQSVISGTDLDIADGTQVLQVSRDSVRKTCDHTQ